MAPSRQLAELARLHGVQQSYSDQFGVHRQASDQALASILTALGVPLTGDAVGESLARLWGRVLEPVTVAWDGEGIVSVRVNADDDGGYAVRLILEGGDAREAAGRLADAPVRDRADVRGRAIVQRALPLPADIPAGYHDVEVTVGGATHAARLIAAPRRTYQTVGEAAGRHWGVFLPLYAMRGQRGTGSLQDLQHLIEWVEDRGGSLVGTLPLLAAYLDTPFEPSPYVPVSRLFWNELFLEPTTSKDWSQQAADALDTARGTFDRLTAAPMVDYAAQMAALRPALEVMAKAAVASGHRRAELEAYAAAHPELELYARFRGVVARHRTGWHGWPDDLANRPLREGDWDEAERRYHRYVQFSLHEQLQALSNVAKTRGLGLYLDLPVGVHGDGYDTWRHRDLFVTGASVGAPPDQLFIGGQNWGVPAMHPERSRQHGHTYMVAMIRNHLRYAGVLRIDHVMGLHRLFWVPQGLEATEGVYVRYPHEELYAILSLESHRCGTLLVGEDLGTVPDVVRHNMAEHGVRGMHVMQFALDPSPVAAIRPAAAGSVASLGTHDTPTFAAFAAGLDIDDGHRRDWIDTKAASEQHADRSAIMHDLERDLRARQLIGAEPELGDILRGSLQVLGQSEAEAVLVNLEDLWLEPAPQNVPGTGAPEPNWRRRARFSLKTLDDLPNVVDTLAALDSARRTPMQQPQIGAIDHSVTGLGDHDHHLFNEGTHRRLDQKLGAHVTKAGVRFAVWAPNADRVSVIGDFNDWSPGAHPLVARGRTGIWEGVVPGLGEGALYKYAVGVPGGDWLEKADPYGFLHECPPRTASVVWALDYHWSDDAWMQTRHGRHRASAPLSIYEVHFGSWARNVDAGGRSLTYREMAPRLAAHLGKHGFTHVEFMPVMEHPFYGSWGYQLTGFFAPTARYGTPQDFMYLVDYLHREGIGVILDWVPSHFPNDGHGLASFDGTYLYEHADPRQGFHPDWKSCIFNYGRHEVRSFLISNALFWLRRYHVDGLRVDAVASMLYLNYSRDPGDWIPNQYGGHENLEAIGFAKQLNDAIHEEHPDVLTIAEESTAWPGVSSPTQTGGLGFDMKWDMGWMHDTLAYMQREAVHRKWHHDELTFRMIYAYDERFVLSLSHDEVVHGKGSLINKMPGDPWQQRANLRLLYGYMFTMPGKKLLFMGQEIGQRQEWAHDRSIDWHLLHDEDHAGIARWVGDLNAAYRREPALHRHDFDASGFEWVSASDSEQSVLAYVRVDHGGAPGVVAVANFTPVVRHDYQVGVPWAGTWTEILNSDAARYGGSNVGNSGAVHAERTEVHGYSHALTLTLPPLAIVVLRAPGD